MSCEICSRGNCIPSFHSFEEQAAFEDKAGDIKDRARSIISNIVNRNVEGFHQMVDGEEVYLVDLAKVLAEIENADL